MAKKEIKSVLKLNLKGGAANPAPPVGPILGQAGINIMEFCKQYNDATQDRRGEVIPAEITVFTDGSFKFVLKKAPVAAMIMKAVNAQKGSGTPNKDFVGSLTMEQVRAIAADKMDDTNATSIEGAMNMVKGTARSMGVQITE